MSGYVVATDPELVKAARGIWEYMASITGPSIGLEWRIVIERDGQPAAEVIRTISDGITIGFYADEEDPS